MAGSYPVSEYGIASLSRRMSGIPQIPTQMIIVRISKRLIISYDRSRIWVGALPRSRLIQMFAVDKVEIMSSAFRCNGKHGGFRIEQPWSDFSFTEGAVYNVLDSNP